MSLTLHSRRQLAVALRNSERQSRDQRAADTDLICRFLPDSTLTYVNDAYCRFFRKSARELVGTKFLDLIPESWRDTTLRDLSTLVATKQRLEREHEVFGPDGAIFWLRWTNDVVLNDVGHVVELQGTGRDVTDRRQMAAKLYQSNARNDALLRAIPDLMFVMSIDGVYLDYHAPDASKLFVSPDQFLGKRMDEIMPPDLSAKFHHAFDEVLRTGQPSIVEYSLPLPSGTQYFEGRIVGFDEGRAILSIVRDVTDRRVAEQALRHAQADAAATEQLSWMGALAASMAHDINQPLAVIEANASAGLQWMNGSSASSKEYVREILMDITAAAHRATSVIQRTLDLFARQPAGRGPVHLRDLVDAALTTTDMALKRGSVSVSTDVPRDLPPVHADRGMLLQVVLSLISNANEAMAPVDGRAISVNGAMTEDGYLQLALEDTGPGIDPSNVETIFKPFHTSKAGHIGIGLSISRAIVEAHGGVLRASAGSGPGARFEIILPAIGGSAQRVTRN